MPEIKKEIIKQKCTWSDHFKSLQTGWSCFTFVPRFVKLSRTASKWLPLISASRPVILHICAKFWDTISILKITKGKDSAKNVGGATVVHLCR